MLVVGLTGSIAMGKSTAAAHLRSRGVPVFDADAIVHEIYREEAAAADRSCISRDDGHRGCEPQ